MRCIYNAYKGTSKTFVMKNNNLYEKIHIGRIIKDVARQRQVSSGILAQAINRYQRNADKIFRLEDMDVEDVVNYSELLAFFDQHLSPKHIVCSYQNVIERQPAYKNNFSYRVYQWLCPPPSNYEIAIERPNLCHIK